MKPTLIIAFFSLFLLTNCSIDNNNDETPKVYVTYWHLIKVNGGIAGVDTSFPMDKIVWNFNEVTGKLTVKNTNTDQTIEDGFDTGNYPFSVTEVGGKKFLVINSNEFGGFTLTQSQLVIDQNTVSNGTGADGFVYTFKAVVVIEEQPI